MSWALYRSQRYSSVISTNRIILTNQPDWPKIVPLLHWFWNAILWWKKGKLFCIDFHFMFYNGLDIWIIITHIFLNQKNKRIKCFKKFFFEDVEAKGDWFVKKRDFGPVFFFKLHFLKIFGFLFIYLSAFSYIRWANSIIAKKNLFQPNDLKK